MSLFTDIVADVYTITSRSDLVVDTALAVRQATLAAHRSDKYIRDIQEGFLPIGKPTDGSANYQIDIPSYFPNWRAFAYLRPYDSVTQSKSRIVLGPDSFIASDGILDPYSDDKVNVAYVAGSNLNVLLEAAYDSFLYGYYKNPTLSPDDNYESWIAREQPAIITIDAARKILESVGYEDAAKRLKDILFGVGGDYHNVVGGEYGILKASSLEAGGR